MEQKNDQQTTKNRESEARGIPPPPRRTSSLKMSSKTMERPPFRFAKVDVPPAASSFMAPSNHNFPFSSPTAARADVGAQLDHQDTDHGPTRCASTIALKPFAISKEHVGSHQFFQRPIIPATDSAATVPVWDSKKKAVPLKHSNWKSPSLNKLPRYFPLERTNRRIKIEECSFEDLQSRLSDGLRVMSIQAKFFNRPASAALLTPENVELYLALWESDDGKEVIVEVQRRRGDTVIFHQYANHIMDAASGNFDDALFINNEGSLLYLQSTEQKLRSELSRIAPEHDMDKESVVALEIVYDLLQKERRDARQLGMEGVCVLANARKTVLSAAILASRAILLGDETQASQGLHEILLGIIQKRTIGGQDEVMGGDYPVDSDDEQFFLDDVDEIRDYPPEYKEEITLLFNLALDALSHALEVVTNFGVDASNPPDQTFSASWVIDTFLVHARQLSDTDLLSTLLQTLQRAYLKPHNAWLAAKCLRFICAASPSAAQRTVKYGGMQFVENAFDVGIASHAKLESECRMLQGVLACAD